MPYSDIYHLIIKGLAFKIDNETATEKEVDLYLQMTTTYHLSGNYNKALEPFRSLIQIYPKEMKNA